MMQLQGRSALVTGAANGIGRAIALGLAEAGADVAASDLDKANVSTLKAEIEALGRKCLAIETDVGDVAAIDAMVSETVEVFGKLDIIVNNAAVTHLPAPMETVTESDLDRVFAVNCKSIYLISQSLVP
ncbi:MAG: SDR family NAD(P)-dependent oxidoreductase, partial [Hyphomicrobiaceae bacterium]